MIRRWVAVLLLSVAVTSMAVLPAAAQTDGIIYVDYVINSFDVDIEVRPDGSLRVTEVISVEFLNDRRGIFRVIPVRYGLNPDDLRIELPEGRRPDEYYRAIDLSDIDVSSPTAPDETLIERPNRFEGTNLRIRIGEEDTYIRGQHTYRIAYTVEGALNEFDEHDELVWNATGDEWDTLMRSVSTTVHGVPIDRIGCWLGPRGTTNLCLDPVLDGDRAVFTANMVPPYSGLTIAIAFPKGAVDPGEPILVEKWHPVRALWGSAAAIPMAVVTGLLSVIGLNVLLYRQGRDRVAEGYVGVDGTVRSDVAQTPPRGLFSGRDTSVQFRPPDGLRPGELGLIIDERVDPIDLSATIVDLAVRGYLRIEEESDKFLFFTRDDWKFIKLKPADDSLRAYEKRLFNGIFESGDEVLLSDLRGEFASDYSLAQKDLYQAGDDNRWFNGRPDLVRSKWAGLGALGLFVSIGLFALAFIFSKVAIAVVPLILVSFVMITAHRHMPHRTSRGSRLLNETLGFKEFIETAETGRMQFAEDANLFVEYLPYAIVFGATDKWAKAFEHLGEAVAASVGAWYVGRGFSDGHFHANRFSASISELGSTVGSSLSYSPSASGSSGFSGGGGGGGGFGGGGGGSW